MQGKTVVVTGASGGIGLETTRALAARGARVIMVVRNRAKAEAVIEAIRKGNAGATGTAGGTHSTPEPGAKGGTRSTPVPAAKLDIVIADLYSMAEVRRAAAEIRALTPRLDVLINNAGLIHDRRELTVDGLERTFALNHLAAFLMTYELRSLLAASAPARVVTVSSMGHRFARFAWNDLATMERWTGALFVYGASKLCNIWFARESARRLAGAGVTSNTLHPGAVASSFGETGGALLRAGIKVVKPLLLTPEEGARTSVYLASSPDVANVTGEFFVRCKIATPSRQARDDDSARRLWQLSEQLCGVTWA